MLVLPRRLNDVTAAALEVMSVLQGLLLEKRDPRWGGVIVLRPDGRSESFKITMRRFGAKVLDVARLQAWVPLDRLSLFDALALDGEELIDSAERGSARGRSAGHSSLRPLWVP